jgi:DNA polymerase V
LRSVETASFPSPAQDYYDGGLSLDTQLIPRPAATFVMRCDSDNLVGLGIHRGDEVLVDRSLSHRPGRVIVVEPQPGERRIGRLAIQDGRAALLTDTETIVLDGQTYYWGVVTSSVRHHYPAPGDHGPDRPD